MSMLRDLLSLSRQDGGEGSSTPYAVIDARYPVGEKCAVTNGTITLKAPDKSGRALFAIPTPETTPEVWTVSSHYQGTLISNTVTVSEANTVYLASATSKDALKAMMKETSYCRLSTAIGDKEKFSDRYMVRTSGEPIIFIRYDNKAGTYRGYAVICKTASAPLQTYSSSGSVKKDSNCPTITIGNNTFYWYVMDGQYSYSYTNIEYTTDEEAEHFTDDLYIRKFDSASSSTGYELRVVAASDAIAAEFTKLCDIYAMLPA